MLVCVDVDYRDSSARPGDRAGGPDGGRTSAYAAAVVFANWTSSTIAAEHVVRLAEVADYESGQFYKRELPCVLAVLERVEFGIHAVVIDGYVVLDEHGTPGLGGHLWEALGHRVPIIGVAKNPFHDNPAAIAVLRGDSSRPLYVTALGTELETAAADVQRMHGRFRLPTMLKRVDRLCRDAEDPRVSLSE
jgi:deoxyribonuclease V